MTWLSTLHFQSGLPKVLLLNQGPLKKWTEHSNYQIHSRGDSKNLIALLIPNIFWIFFIKVFIYAYKSWGQDPIWYFSCLCRKFSEQKCPCWAALKTSSSELITIFDPSLERSWYELFRIRKAHGPKNQPPSSPGV